MNKPISKAIENSIRTLFDEYLNEPLLYLRESNLQFRLNQLILEALVRETGRDTVFAKIVPSRPRYENQHPKEIKVKQSQTELKIAEAPQTVSTKSGAIQSSRNDIVVFKGDEVIMLNKEKAGPLDITAKVRAQDVAAVIEIKSAPSANKSIPKGLTNDVIKLISLIEAEEIPDELEAHFINFDKSIGVAGHIAKEIDPVEWEEDGQNRFVISDSPLSGRYIHVWDIDPSSAGNHSIRHRYAYRSPPAAE